MPLRGWRQPRRGQVRAAATGERIILNGDQNYANSGADPDGAEWTVDTNGSDFGFLLGFQGKRFEAETGNWNFLARHQNPALGTFQQRDPSGAAYQDGMNLYSFVELNPLLFVDPTGYAKQPAGGPPGFGKGKWKVVTINGKMVFIDPNGHEWKWHNGDRDRVGHRHKDHWDVEDKKGKKTRRDPATGADLGAAIDEERNERENAAKRCELPRDPWIDAIIRGDLQPFPLPPIPPLPPGLPVTPPPPSHPGWDRPRPGRDYDGPPMIPRELDWLPGAWPTPVGPRIPYPTPSRVPVPTPVPIIP